MTISQDRRLWLGGGVLAAVLLVAASWFLLISPTMSDTSSLKSQTTDGELQSTVLSGKLAKLKQQKDGIAALQSQLAGSLLALPTDSGLPALTRQLTQQAKNNGVVLGSIVVTGVSRTSPNGGSIVGAGTGSASAAGGLYAIPVSVVVGGAVKNELAFLHSIQFDGPRTALVNATSFMPLAGTSSATLDRGAALTVQLTVYSAPKSPLQEKQLQQDVAAAASAGVSN
ncbi:hypothetical protein M6D93_05935 [Jatrophihabitans telluris]|uniref:DUF881 domain-containing protein n=1 Tax=Jatrophihabitans telluris TaxID=2038343 RepID=A0ABY4R0X1_9ACTN|nr:hypothetical protein [Jatrophihabitans telluris]UQX89546.1 hypothetical protein M6D93_05935 [Jatrophihabitans telluris]